MQHKHQKEDIRNLTEINDCFYCNEHTNKQNESIYKKAFF